MKLKKLIFPLFIVGALFLNSCVLKSLHPFYVSSAVSFEKKIVGKWLDNKKGAWEITPLQDEFEKDGPLSEADIAAFKRYKDGYAIQYIEDDKEAIFIGMPFKVNDHLFIDFNLVEFDDNGLNDLVKSNVIETHTVAKVALLKSGDLDIKWLDESAIETLLEKNQIQIKHEKLGHNESLVLTGSSADLYKFLKKYIESDIEDKWQTSKKFTLKRINEKL